MRTTANAYAAAPAQLAKGNVRHRSTNDAIGVGVLSYVGRGSVKVVLLCCCRGGR
jgi:hypothetical protein